MFGAVSTGLPYLWEYGILKTTIELPDTTLRRAKALAAGRGVTLKRFFTEAVEEKLSRCLTGSEAPWMAGFGVLAELSEENRQILRVIAEEFETVSPEDLE